MGRINIKNNIEIERNVIEKYLIKIKDFSKARSSIILYIFIAFIVILSLSIFGVWKYTNYKASQLAKFEVILENYEKNSKNDKDINKTTLKELLEMSKARNFGFVDEMIPYMIGNLYFKEKDYKEAKNYLMKFIEKSDAPIFNALARLKMGISMEELNDTKGALKVYLEMENRYGESEVIDQVLFNIARIYMKDNNTEETSKYYNKLITQLPSSSFAEKAKKRLLLLGLKK